MEMLKHFLECYFHSNESFDHLNQCIIDYKVIESETSQYLLIKEFYHTIQTQNYSPASKIIKKYGGRTFDEEKTKKFINFLYDRFIDRPTDITPQDFQRKFKGVFCPVCCPNPKVAITLSLIEKAKIIEKDQPIYICKQCKLVWLTEDIQANNGQNYKNFMKKLGLKGTWKELKDIDYL